MIDLEDRLRQARHFRDQDDIARLKIEISLLDLRIRREERKLRP